MQKVRTPPRASGHGVKARRLPLFYVLFWSFAGAASAAYLGVIVSDPDLVSALSGPAKPGTPLERPSDELFATPQVNTLRDRLSNAQTDIAKLRSELDDHKQTYGEEPAEVADAGQSPAEHTDFVSNGSGSNNSGSEAGYDMATTAGDEPPVTAIAEPSRTAAAYEQREPAPVVGVPGISVPGISLFEPPSSPAYDPAPSPPVSEVAIANAAIESGPSEPSSIETGAIPVPPAPEPGIRPKPVAVAVVSEPGPTAAQPAPAANSPIKVAPVKVTATPPAQNVALAPAAASRGPAEAKQTIGVRLATGPSLEALRVTWKAMLDRHPEALKGLAPRYVKQDALGSAPFSLVAGPVSKPMDVLEICADLGGEARECALATFTGKKL